MNVHYTAEWRDNKPLPECMMFMLQNEIMCDVTLRVGHYRTSIKAHKYMLSSRSDVFHTMFEGSLPEKGDIKIPDIEENTFRDILKYIYCDQISITNDNVKEILYAADKYMLAAVKRECETVLKQTAQSEHATKALQTGYQHSLLDLQRESLDYIEINTKECLLSEYALSLSRDCLGLILKSDYLNCTETDICHFIIKWGKHQCKLANLEPSGGNIREVLGTNLYMIRFQDVDMKFFSKEIVVSGLLTDDETVSIYQSHFGEVSKIFSNIPRYTVTQRKTITVYRYEQISQPMATTGIQSIIFLSDNDIWLKGVHIFLPYVQPTYGHQVAVSNNVNISIQILNDSNEEKIHHDQRITYGQNYDQVLEVKFSKPLHIHARRDYTIQMNGMCYQTYCGINCKESVTESESGVTVKFKDSSVGDNETNISTGQFAGLSFSV
ncbi:BTB/POZ domain-containing protein 6-B-like isoform X2 [Mytilus californianus]|nr:BTB/POZ domain-containing protein 6-B-like isoform X2 [Mytilus californianus]